MRPTVGRVVHYISHGSPNGQYLPEHRSAMITAVDSAGGVSLAIFNPTGIFFSLLVPEDQTAQAPGSWHWPEREG